MAMKQIAQKLQPLPLYSVLGLTVCLFFIELVTAHVTHSLTLLLDSYLALCNIIVLVGSIISIKHGSGRSDGRMSTANNSSEELKSLASLSRHSQTCSATEPGPERHLRNTFGWARVDVVVVLIACVFLMSLCFSVVLEAMLTLFHISHHDEMHGAIVVLGLGLVSLLLNLLAYLLIGGYTFHQGSFLNKEVALKKDSSTEKVDENHENQDTSKSQKRQGIRGLCRDCIGSVVVIICASVVYCTESQVAKFIDPALSIVSVLMSLFLSLPFLKESGFILLQTIPDHINIGSLCSQLISTFPVIVNVHELHVWRLTGNKTYCTAHIIFLNPKEYCRINSELSRFFLTHGITHITVQPEFFEDMNHKELLSSNTDCLVPCKKDMCMERHCCASDSPSLDSVHVDTHSHKHKGSCKEINKKCLKLNVDSKLPENGAVLTVAASCVSQLAQVNASSGAVPAADQPSGITNNETLVSYNTLKNTEYEVRISRIECESDTSSVIKYDI